MSWPQPEPTFALFPCQSVPADETPVVKQLPACIKSFCHGPLEPAEQAVALTGSEVTGVHFEGLAAAEVEDQLPQGWHQTQVCQRAQRRVGRLLWGWVCAGAPTAGAG